jgi:serine/threonine-protein phosphatase 6 regulatory ankyrin repeat subunit A
MDKILQQGSPLTFQFQPQSSAEQKKLLALIQAVNLNDPVKNNSIIDLLKNGLSLTTVCHHHKTLFYHIITTLNMDILQYIMHNYHQGDIDEMVEASLDCFEGQTALHWAVAQNHMLMASQLLEMASSFIDRFDALSNTPLHMACIDKKEDMIGLLISKRANIFIRNALGATPLHLCAIQGLSGSVRLLLQTYRNHPDFIFHRNYIKQVHDFNQYTALHHAIAANNKEIVILLIQHGIFIDSILHNGKTPLYLAVELNHFELAKYLLQQGARLDRIILADKNSPLVLALKANHLRMVELLLSYNARVNKVSLDKKTSLYLAVETGSLELVKLILARGVNVDEPSTDLHITPFFLAIKKSYLNIAEFLFFSGAELNGSSLCEKTPLEWASQQNNSESIIDFLQQHGAQKERSCSRLK